MPLDRGVDREDNTVGYYSAIKWEEIVPFSETCMDLEPVIQSEVSQKEKNTARIFSSYMWNLEN